MGYILPITHYNYQDYQNRMKEQKESPHYVGSPYKVVFHRISSELNEDNEKSFDELKLEHLDDDMKPKRRKLAGDFFHITKRQKANITGKGGNINAQI